VKRVLAGVAIGALLFMGSGSAVLAGEVNGRGDTTPVKTGPPGLETNAPVAASECAFSGLEDDDGGANGGPGVTPQTPALVAGTGFPGQGFEGPHGFASCNPQDTTPGTGL
jgi:hypothetical protein